MNQAERDRMEAELRRHGELKATPVKNPQAEAAARALQKLHGFLSKPFGYQNPPGEMLSSALGVPDVAKTLERIGYGEPLTTGAGGLGGTTRPREETVNAALAASGLAPSTRGLPAGATIKPKGGNWLAGSVERAIEPMRTVDPAMMDVLRNSDPRLVDQTALNRVNAEGMAIDKWLDKKLARYIRNEMATPEDPLRALAERGVTHIPEGVEGLERAGSWVPENLGPRRKTAGFPAEGLATTPSGKGWELIADEAIQNLPAGERTRFMGDTPWRQQVEENPWLLKVPPETMTYGAYPVEVRQELGFGHLVDELKNAINPASGLPEHLRWKPQHLEKVTVPQAVQRVADINAWRAAQKAEADLARATGPATQVVKEYPEQGFKWVELKAPEALPQGWAEVPESGGTRFTSPSGKMFSKEQMQRMPLEDALKYEGETMGHCVGGYCPDVLEGRSRIFSLRDAKGEPHVTVEVRPGKKLTEQDLPDDVRDMLAEQYGDAPREEFEAAVANYFKQQAVPDEIVQIKGKQNRAPKEEYLPFVQDFVKTGQWGRVGDLQNTGLYNSRSSAQAAIDLGPRYTPEIARRFETMQPNEYFTLDELISPPPEYAEGGSVKTPWLFSVPSYSETVAYETYPGQRGQDDRQDALRHMLASGTLTRKYGPGVASFLAKAHEYKTSPFKALGTLFGGQMPPDFEMDTHNNAVGIKLGEQAATQEELERLAIEAAERASKERAPGRAYIKKAEGGTVNPPADFTAPDMSDGGSFFPDPDYMRMITQQR